MIWRSIVSDNLLSAMMNMAPLSVDGLMFHLRIVSLRPKGDLNCSMAECFAKFCGIQFIKHHLDRNTISTVGLILMLRSNLEELRFFDR